jgi:hypothetical protein
MAGELRVALSRGLPIWVKSPPAWSLERGGRSVNI